MWNVVGSELPGVHTLMLVAKELCEVDPWSQLSPFVDELRTLSETKHCPKITEVKWNSAFYALDYILQRVPENTSRHHK